MGDKKECAHKYHNMPKLAILVMIAFLLIASGCSERVKTKSVEVTGDKTLTITVTVTPIPDIQEEPTITVEPVMQEDAAADQTEGIGDIDEQEQEQQPNLEGKTCEELIDMIKNGAESERQSAEAELIKLGDVNIKQLAAAYVNTCKIQDLRNIQEEKEAEKLLKKFGSPKNELSDIQTNLGNVLIGLGNAATKPLLKAIGNGDLGTMEYDIGNILINIGAPAVDTLIPYTKSDNYSIVSCVVSVLGSIGDERAVEPLITLLKNDENELFCDTTQSALAQLGTPSVEPLIKLIQDDKTYANSSAQEYAAETLGDIKDPQAIKPLLKLLDHKDVYIRIAAARGLGEFKDDRVDSCMAEAISKQKLDIIAGAHQYYIRQGDSSTEKLLIKALDKYGESDMAADYLNSGNEKLEAAAQKWAEDNGYFITSIPGFGGDTQWGSDN